MADRRKLQGEIERCLKKVAEGVESFEDTWKKVYSATNVNQKEKYEADLKKEIKKLQRLRDQIKTWLTSSDIKDKRSLQDARKLIETQMERFKVVERETKTKAYSKEGLGAAQKLDPAQKERDEITAWLTACIESLNIQIDKFESEIDTINFSLKKKKNDKEKLDRLEELKSRREKHQYHIRQLEALLRMLDNDSVEVVQIQKIKEDVEYYRDCSMEPDFQENEFLYDDLALEDMEEYLAQQQAAYQQSQLDLKNAALEEDSSTILTNSPISSSSNSRSHSPCLENHSSEDSKAPEPSPSKNPPIQPSSPTNLNNSISSESSSPAFSHVNSHNSLPVINSTSQPPSTPFSTATVGLPNNHYKMSNNHESTWSPSTSLDEDPPNDVNMKPALSPEAIVSSAAPTLSNSSWTETSNSWNNSGYRFREQELCANPVKEENDQEESSLFNDTENPIIGGTEPPTVNCPNENSRLFGSSVPVSSNSVYSDDDAQSTLKRIAERAVLNSGMSNNIHNLQFSSLENKGSQLTHNIIGSNSNDMFIETSLSKPSPSTVSTEINISQIFGEFPENCFNDEQRHCLSILDVAYKRLPMPMDSQRHRYTNPGAPANTPDYYPSNVPNSNSVEFFQRLSTETLFFIFYFLQGTKAQYLAARALKSKSWRFHTMYMMWFQRHEEPKTITDDYEQGTYVYFDFEKWMQRKKEGFTFEYKYLEDKDLN